MLAMFLIGKDLVNLVNLIGILYYVIFNWFSTYRRTSYWL